MKQYNKWIILPALIALLLAACSQEELDTVTPQNPDPKTTKEFCFNITTNSFTIDEAQSRAGGDHKVPLISGGCYIRSVLEVYAEGGMNDVPIVHQVVYSNHYNGGENLGNIEIDNVRLPVTEDNLIVVCWVDFVQTKGVNLYYNADLLKKVQQLFSNSTDLSTSDPSILDGFTARQAFYTRDGVTYIKDADDQEQLFDLQLTARRPMSIVHACNVALVDNLTDDHYDGVAYISYQNDIPTGYNALTGTVLPTSVCKRTSSPMYVSSAADVSFSYSNHFQMYDYIFVGKNTQELQIKMSDSNSNLYARSGNPLSVTIHRSNSEFTVKAEDGSTSKTSSKQLIFKK